jgi:DNA topoisomerase I
VTQVGNFRVEPPGLFRGRGEHPKMGKIKRRVYPRDVTINIGAGEPTPEHPYPGQTWKEVRHDNTVTWLAFWKDTISEREYKVRGCSLETLGYAVAGVWVWCW